MSFYRYYKGVLLKYEKITKKQSIIVICGVKNSGKTTLITKLIPKFTSLGYKVATIKHDGHDFDADVEGTDSYKHKQAGAYGTAVFSLKKQVYGS